MNIHDQIIPRHPDPPAQLLESLLSGLGIQNQQFMEMGIVPHQFGEARLDDKIDLRLRKTLAQEPEQRRRQQNIAD